MRPGLVAIAAAFIVLIGAGLYVVILLQDAFEQPPPLVQLCESRLLATLGVPGSYERRKYAIATYDVPRDQLVNRDVRRQMLALPDLYKTPEDYLRRRADEAAYFRRLSQSKEYRVREHVVLIDFAARDNAGQRALGAWVCAVLDLVGDGKSVFTRSDMTAAGRVTLSGG